MGRLYVNNEVSPTDPMDNIFSMDNFSLPKPHFMSPNHGCVTNPRNVWQKDCGNKLYGSEKSVDDVTFSRSDLRCQVERFHYVEHSAFLLL